MKRVLRSPVQVEVVGVEASEAVAGNFRFVLLR
jgi:hypothetical protein